ncbi:MAG: PKD domain-containing protein, partial [bacterium]|nr:PKD domain-containing protein [bacterium]
ATRLSGETPLSVQFLDLSAGDVRSYLWTFGDGTSAALQNPVHVYGAPGSYEVSLTVSGPAGGDTENKSSYIRVEQGGVVTPCVEGTETLCLSDDRFRVEVRWRDFDGNTGSGRMVPFGSDDSGLFWFFDAANWEMLVKVLDGCAVNDHYWVFAAATTNVEYTLEVTDTETAGSRSYFNELGVSSPATTDATAFDTCP